ncbi:hypothetical protein Val02_53070 [Virgisporangium aliadipatigenens]|uniref:Peptidase C51 domain-containing protein n=1 Tax=Virgisporangium aliadipatigenens TaxID=741659 RepID=A0A8J3YNE0_9ACTN|nr:FG-GAP-like repeat-containing protein [Virgisporangium aliadipatigenens]GIJ48421.1 hypothetical protein Val02_53070 [Virgisporangium aliadipatigenens]
MNISRTGRAVLALSTMACAALGTLVVGVEPADAAASRSAIVAAAEGQLGGSACDPGYYHSCGMEWCAEFARWAWRHGGVTDYAGLNGWAQSFKEYGEDRGTYHSRGSGYTPQPGDAIVFDWDHSSGDSHPIDHVAIVTDVSSSSVTYVGGNQGDPSRVRRSSIPRSSGDLIGFVEPADVSGGRAPVGAAMAYDEGDGTFKTYRWTSDGDRFNRASDYESGAFSLGNVDDRIASGDVNGDGKDDIVMAYQKNDGTFAYYVWRNGNSAAQIWYTSGAFDLDNVAGRLVVDDFNGDGRAEPAMAYDQGDGTMRIFRWLSDGNSFNRTSDYDSGAFSLGAVGNRMAAGDINGDGRADIVMAYQRGDGTFAYYVWRNGNSAAQVWYESGSFNLGNVAGRLVVDDFTGDGKAEPAMAYDQGDGTMRTYRWKSDGTQFNRTADYDSGAFSLGNVGDRMASGDVNGDGRGDIVMAYQRADGTFAYYVWFNGSSAAEVWYTSGAFSLGRVGGRLVLGNW